MQNTEYKKRFRLPNTLENWPWQRTINPLYEEVKVESSAWLESLQLFDEKTQKAFDACDFNLCAALAYPLFDKERLRTCADVMYFYFAFDAYSDVEDEVNVKKQRDVIMDALRNPHVPRPEGECLLGEMVRQMWARAIPTASRRSQVKFVETIDLYTAAVVQEAEDRRLGKIRGIEGYLEVRRGTVGVHSCLALLELDANIDEDLMNNEAVKEVERLAVDLSILGNDMVSYILERDMGHWAHNLVTNVMHDMKTDVDGAMRWIKNQHTNVVDQYMKAMERMPSAGKDLEMYVWGVGNWVRAIDSWYFESERYFGKEGLQVQKERWVTLHPRKETPVFL